MQLFVIKFIQIQAHDHFYFSIISNITFYSNAYLRISFGHLLIQQETCKMFLVNFDHTSDIATCWVKGL